MSQLLLPLISVRAPCAVLSMHAQTAMDKRVKASKQSPCRFRLHEISKDSQSTCKVLKEDRKSLVSGCSWRQGPKEFQSIKQVLARWVQKHSKIVPVVGRGQVLPRYYQSTSKAHASVPQNPFSTARSFQ